MGELARDLAEALDPVLWAERVTGHMLDPWQAELLRGDCRRVLLNVCRQGGKSTTAGALGLYVAQHEPGALVLLLSPSQRQSGELLRTVAGLYGADDSAVQADAQSVLRLELANGSRIISLPGKEATVRGFAGVRLIVIDEAARVSDDLYYSVRPMLAVSGGGLVAMSTPFGKRGWWHKEWTEGQGWQRIQVTAEQCPRISPAFLAEERATIGAWWFAQEYMCQFGETSDQVFSYELVAAALRDDIKPLEAAKHLTTARESEV
ncbi:MAG TPA: terminase family protein [Anaerolineae bacterium]|nr:terminase family protein [Anaerolineae bacterium]